MHRMCNQLYSTESGAELAEKSLQMCSVAMKLHTKMFEMWQDLSVEFSFAKCLKGTY